MKAMARVYVWESGGHPETERSQVTSVGSPSPDEAARMLAEDVRRLVMRMAAGIPEPEAEPEEDA